jgi:uncharacterized membrane protein
MIKTMNKLKKILIAGALIIIYFLICILIYDKYFDTWDKIKAGNYAPETDYSMKYYHLFFILAFAIAIVVIGLYVFWRKKNSKVIKRDH